MYKQSNISNDFLPIQQETPTQIKTSRTKTAKPMRLVLPCWLEPTPNHIVVAQTMWVMATSINRVCGTLNVAIPLLQFFLKKA